MATELTQRRQMILKLVVGEFIESATAVSSDAIVRKYQLPISSATVRNELAALEELGYLTHPHTSAGRIPTDAGYRLFVEHLMDDMPLSPDEQHTIRHRFYEVRGEADQLIPLAAATAARTAHNASVVTPPRAYQCRFKHLELLSIRDTTILMVLVLSDGTVKQQTVTLQTAIPPEQLRMVAARINQRCEDATITVIEQLLAQEFPDTHPHLSVLEQHVLELVVRSLQQIEVWKSNQIHSDGLMEMLSQPEFLPSFVKDDDVHRAVEHMRQILDILTSGQLLGQLILRTLASDSVQVIIGTEHETDQMHRYSVVLSRYGVDGELTGVVGIIGPTRMAYPRSISTVRYIASVMSDLMSEMYGAEQPTSPTSPQRWSVAES